MTLEFIYLWKPTQNILKFKTQRKIISANSFKMTSKSQLFFYHPLVEIHTEALHKVLTYVIEGVGPFQ
jgi:hypothetical protein